MLDCGFRDPCKFRLMKFSYLILDVEFLMLLHLLGRFRPKLEFMSSLSVVHECITRIDSEDGFNWI